MPQLKRHLLLRLLPQTLLWKSPLSPSPRPRPSPPRSPLQNQWLNQLWNLLKSLQRRNQLLSRPQQSRYQHLSLSLRLILPQKNLLLLSLLNPYPSLSLLRNLLQNQSPSRQLRNPSLLSKQWKLPLNQSLWRSPLPQLLWKRHQSPMSQQKLHQSLKLPMSQPPRRRRRRFPRKHLLPSQHQRNLPQKLRQRRPRHLKNHRPSQRFPTLRLRQLNLPKLLLQSRYRLKSLCLNQRQRSLFQSQRLQETFLTKPHLPSLKLLLSRPPSQFLLAMK